MLGTNCGENPELSGDNHHEFEATPQSDTTSLADATLPPSNFQEEPVRLASDLVVETAHLTHGQVQFFAEQLVELYKSGFQQPDIDFALKDLVEHIRSSERLRIHEKGLGFCLTSTLQWNDDLVLHLEGIIVDRTKQSRGIGRELLGREIAETGATILGFHTQSKLMLKLGSHFAQFEDTLAINLADAIGTRNPNGVIDVGRYGHEGLYGPEVPAAELLSDILDVSRGDALICVGRIRLGRSNSV